ncbi:MAG: hypothetical protein WA265_14580 [Rhodomicrobium sp.]
MAEDENLKARSVFVTGLKNAHAMENQALELHLGILYRVRDAGCSHRFRFPDGVFALAIGLHLPQDDP